MQDKFLATPTAPIRHHPHRLYHSHPRIYHPSQDELLATELVFSGLLTDLTPAEVVALISALVFQVRVR